MGTQRWRERTDSDGICTVAAFDMYCMIYTLCGMRSREQDEWQTHLVSPRPAFALESTPAPDCSIGPITQLTLL